MGCSLQWTDGRCEKYGCVEPRPTNFISGYSSTTEAVHIMEEGNLELKIAGKKLNVGRIRAKYFSSFLPIFGNRFYQRREDTLPMQCQGGLCRVTMVSCGRERRPGRHEPPQYGIEPPQYGIEPPQYSIEPPLYRQRAFAVKHCFFQTY